METSIIMSIIKKELKNKTVKQKEINIRGSLITELATPFLD